MIDTHLAESLFADQTGFLRAFLDAVPAMLFVVDEDVAILECNAAAARVLDVASQDAVHARAGDIMRCIHAVSSTEGCGRTPDCRDCIIRGSVRQAFRGRDTVRRRAKLDLVTEGGTREVFALITARAFLHEGRRLALLVLEDISQLVELQQIVPICACCKKVRNDDQYWMGVDAYFKKEWDVDFSHGYCPGCAREELARIRPRSSGRDGPAEERLEREHERQHDRD